MRDGNEATEKWPTKGPEIMERPQAVEGGNAVFGSDAIADTLRSLDIPYIAINPGASYRGLHDSLVNHLGNQSPQILLCLHEESAVAIAHGYAKVTGRSMLAAVHSNVGLMHASMSVFNAWCDRAPLILLGATGPVDAANRRPWIDWLHTARDQGALIRNYVKWDDQPASVQAAQEALLRAVWLSESNPKAPVYINLDVDIQEERLETVPPQPDTARFMPRMETGLDAATVSMAAAHLRRAQKPVILMGRMSRHAEAWAARVGLAESLNARVITTIKTGAAFPTQHRLHAGSPGTYIDAEGMAALKEADVILSLDWIDLAGTLQTVFGRPDPDTIVIQASVDHNIHNGWSMDHYALPGVDILLAVEPDKAVSALLTAIGGKIGAIPVDEPLPALEDAPASESGEQVFTPAEMTRHVRRKLSGRRVSLVHARSSWNRSEWPFRHPLDYFGSKGGGGIGGGPGIAVGAALALADTGRLPVALLGDGDFLMGATALWTAVHYHVPLLIVIANNQSFYNDEVHQQIVAQARKRPVENKWIGQRMTDPEIDLAQIAAAQGALGLGPARNGEQLDAMLDQALAHIEAGGVAVIDARVGPGYTPAMRAAMRGSI